MAEIAHPARPRGEETREALLEAGIELFGQLGYEGATSRALARAADVNQALIGYHFGGKRGLYVAVFEQVARQMTARLQPAREAIAPVLEGEGANPEDLTRILLEVLDRLVDTFTSPQTAAWAALIVREQQRPSEAFDVLFERAMFPMLDLLSRLVAALEGKPADAPEIRLLVLTIVGQTLVFRVARASVLRTLAVDELAPAEIAAIKRRIHSNVLAILSLENDA